MISMQRSSRDRPTVYVIDTAGFFAGYQLGINNAYTVPEVIEEVRDKHSRLLLQYSLEAKKVSVIDPNDKYVTYVAGIARRLGELSNLSKTDLKLHKNYIKIT